MPKLSQLLGDEVPATLEFPASDVKVIYRPSVYTREFEAQLERIGELAKAVEAAQADPDAEPVVISEQDQIALSRDFYDQALCDLLVSWDLTDDDETLIPLTPADINAKVPTVLLIMFVLKLVQAIQGEAAGGRRMTETPPNRATRRAKQKR
jgi:hypothetical protein